MDDYRKTGKEWGRKARKQENRQHKGQLRNQVRKAAEEATAGRYFIETAEGRAFLKTGSHEAQEVRFMGRRAVRCDGCDQNLAKAGWYPGTYDGDVIECQECGTRYFVTDLDAILT